MTNDQLKILKVQNTMTKTNAKSLWFGLGLVPSATLIKTNLHFRWFGTKPNSLVLVGILVTNGSFTIGIFGWYFIERLINFDDFV